jgi:hypothetical protein
MKYTYTKKTVREIGLLTKNIRGLHGQQNIKIVYLIMRRKKFITTAKYPPVLNNAEIAEICKTTKGKIPLLFKMKRNRSCFSLSLSLSPLPPPTVKCRELFPAKKITYT